LSAPSPTLDYLSVLRARKSVVVLTLLVVPVIALFFSLREQPLYQTNATVLLQDQNPAGNLAGAPDLSSSAQPDRFAQTQADLARSPTVIERTLAAAGVKNRTRQDLLDNSTVSSRSNADVLDFQVTDRSPRVAALLANSYANQFIRYQRELDSSNIAASLTDVQRQIDALTARGDHGGALYLTGKLQQLQAIQALQSSHAVLVAPATEASKVQPRPIRNAVLGFAVAIVLGIALAFVWEALDSRVRSAEEISEQLGLPLLGRVPAPTSLRFGAHRMRLLPPPKDTRVDAFRMLRVGLDLITLETPRPTIMVTSIVDGIEKSMTAVNLAMSFARAGRRAVLVDLDLRTRRLGSLAAFDGRPGLMEVALENESLDEALVPIRVDERNGHSPNINASGWGGGVLELLASSGTFPDAGEFLASRTLAEILAKLSTRADVVLIDGPPLLESGDAFTLGARVDAVLLVARLTTLRRPMLNEAARLLERCPARKLGFVVAGLNPPKRTDPKPLSQRSQLRSRAASSPIQQPEWVQASEAVTDIRVDQPAHSLRSDLPYGRVPTRDEMS
jgi:succinoglycan biosynthesis transport protein ExoP